MAKSKTLAVTVSRYYLVDKRWAIKLMSVSLSKDRTYRWHTQKIFMTHHKESRLIYIAMEYALDKNLVYIAGLKQGGYVIKGYQAILEKHYGSKLSELII